jgi:hypothetical protein
VVPLKVIEPLATPGSGVNVNDKIGEAREMPKLPDAIFSSSVVNSRIMMLPLSFARGVSHFCELDPGFRTKG